MSPQARRRWRWVVIAYLVKTALVGAAWLMVPDLPERAVAKVRETWNAVASTR